MSLRWWCKSMQRDRGLNWLKVIFWNLLQTNQSRKREKEIRRKKKKRRKKTKKKRKRFKKIKGKNRRKGSNFADFGISISMWIKIIWIRWKDYPSRTLPLRWCGDTYLSLVPLSPCRSKKHLNQNGFHHFFPGSRSRGLASHVRTICSSRDDPD